LSDKEHPWLISDDNVWKWGPYLSARDGRLYFRHYALGFLKPIRARLAEPFLLSKAPDS